MEENIYMRRVRGSWKQSPFLEDVNPPETIYAKCIGCGSVWCTSEPFETFECLTCHSLIDKYFPGKPEFVDENKELVSKCCMRPLSSSPLAPSCSRCGKFCEVYERRKLEKPVLSIVPLVKK